MKTIYSDNYKIVFLRTQFKCTDFMKQFAVKISILICARQHILTRHTCSDQRVGIKMSYIIPLMFCTIII